MHAPGSGSAPSGWNESPFDAAVYAQPISPVSQEAKEKAEAKRKQNALSSNFRLMDTNPSAPLPMHLPAASLTNTTMKLLPYVPTKTGGTTWDNSLVLIPELPSNIPNTPSGASNAYRSAPKNPPVEAPSPSAFDLFKAELPSFTPSGGFTDPASIPDLVKLLSRQEEAGNPLFAASILCNSKPAVLQAFVDAKGLAICDKWLKANDQDARESMIKLLQKLPVDMAALKDNGSIGKTVKKLSKSASATPELRSLHKEATELLKKWISRVDASAASKKRSLSNRPEPTPKRAKASITTSNAFKTRTSAEEAEFFVVKRKPQPPPAEKLRQPSAKAIEKDPIAAPLRRSTESAPTPPLRSSADGATLPITVATSKKPLTSCLPDMTNRKPKRSISWAPDASLVKVKLFPKDKTMRLNPAAARQRAAMQQRNLQAVAAASKPSLVPAIPWSTPRPILFAKDVETANGAKSTQAAVQRDRERAKPRAFYPDLRHIPATPSVEVDPHRHLIKADRDVPTVPLNGSTAPVPAPAAPVQEISPAQYQNLGTLLKQGTAQSYLANPGKAPPEELERIRQLLTMTQQGQQGQQYPPPQQYATAYGQQPYHPPAASPYHPQGQYQYPSQQQQQHPGAYNPYPPPTNNTNGYYRR